MKLAESAKYAATRYQAGAIGADTFSVEVLTSTTLDRARQIVQHAHDLAHSRRALDHLRHLAA